MAKSSRPYQNETIWIIGASSGIGRALASILAAQGARLILSARSKDELASLAGSLPQAGPQEAPHMVCPLDIANEQEVISSWQEIKDHGLTPDRVIIMAALYEPTPIADIRADSLRAMVNVNLCGAFYVVNAVLPFMKQRQSGQIVLCGSVAGYRGLPGGQPYSATKAAIINFAESLRAEEQSSSLDIKLINPGFVRTALTDKNKFKMPMIIEPEAAARAIAKGLRRRSFEIHFPKKFTFAMKLLRILPSSLYFMLSHKMKGN